MYVLVCPRIFFEVYSTVGSGDEYYVVSYYKTVDLNGNVLYVTEKPESGDLTPYYIDKDASVWLFMLFNAGVRTLLIKDAFVLQHPSPNIEIASSRLIL